MRAAELAFDCRSELAELFSMENPEQVVFTMNATHALNIAIKSLVPPGGRVVISGWEHNAVTRPLAALRARISVAEAPLFSPEETLEAFEQFKQDYGTIDLLVNNAGITIAGDFLTMKPEQFDYCLNVDLRTPYFLAQKAANLMIETGKKGVIINISSNQSEAVFPWASVYGTAKAGLNKLTKHMALELAPYGIRAVAVAPGYCDVWSSGAGGEDSNYTKAIKDCIPLHR